MVELIDTHSHIYDEAFREDFEDVVTRSKEQGVKALVMPGIDIAAYGDMLSTADRLEGYAFPCIGLHPTSVGEGWQEELDFVRAHARDRRFLAIGEIGLDEYWSKDFLAEQKRVFAEQICLAAEMDLPIIIHAREATEDIFNVLSDTRGVPVRGTFHAYSGSYETYRRALTFGDFKFGIGGVVTYKRAGIAEVLPRMSPSDIVLETDCPWLTPVPYRGRRNESSYVAIVAAKVAELTGADIGQVARTTTENARKLFDI